jgi:hypothetical protein
MTVPVHALQGMAPMALDAAGVQAGMAFLNGELEKRDPTLLEPLTSFTWMRDIVAETGGGYVDFTSNYFVDYATAGANQFGIIGGQTNVIPVVQANITKDVFPVFTFANIVKVPFLDQQKMQQIGRSLDQIFDNGLRMNWNKMLDQNVYFGFTDFGQYGLVNHPDVVSSLAPATGNNSSRKWADKTPQAVMNDINSLLVATWAASEYDLEGMANQILVPPAVFSDLNNRIVSDAGSISLLEYLKRYNLATSQGRPLEILPARQCIGQGLPSVSGGDDTDRVVAYVNNKDKVSFDITVPLTRAMTQPSVQDIAYLTAFVGLVGVVKIKYFQTIRYMDGI